MDDQPGSRGAALSGGPERPPENSFQGKLAVAGVSSAGLKTTVFPETSAGKIFQVGIAIGKFQGVISPQTPTGTRTAMLNLFESSDGAITPKSLRPSLAA